jgi:hypothetical protein
MSVPTSVFVRLLLCLMVAVLIMSGCSELGGPEQSLTREEAIPDNAVKVLPTTDIYPPILHSSEWQEPVPLPGPGEHGRGRGFALHP